MLHAQLAERGAVRYTPAGLQALDMLLKHESIAFEAGAPRKVSMQIHAVAIGDEIVQRCARLVVGGEAAFDGFVTTSRNGRGWVYHLTALEPGRQPD